VAFEGLLRAWSNERTLARDASYCVVDKPAGIPCGPAGLAFPEDSLEGRLESHGLGRWRVLSALPERASGAVLLGSGAGAPVVGAAESEPAGLPSEVEALEVVVGIDDCRLPAAGAVALPELAGRGLSYRVVRRNGSRALVQLESHVQPELVLAALRRHGQPVVGDAEAPDAPAATRLMLHVARVRGRFGAAAPLPPELEAWLSGQAEVPPERFAEALTRSSPSRFGLARELGAYRLLGEEAGEVSGVTAERYGDHAVLYLSSEEAARRELALADCLMDHGALGVYVKHRQRADLRGVDAASLAPVLPVRGTPAPAAFPVNVGALVFEVALGDGLATGLFLDQRLNWQRLARQASGGAFLNLFCYTGAFTLAAAAAGAVSTVSVDLAGRALSRVSRNLELNGLSGQAHRLLKADVPAWLARAARAGRRYDCVVLDPPSFGTRARGVLSTRRDNPDLLAAALGVLAPRGTLLAVSHHRKISSRELSQQVAGVCAENGLAARIDPLLGGWDCPTLPGVSGTKSVLATMI
jgi:23S rRNA (cytosine1962-C5)-methyltransferase